MTVAIGLSQIEQLMSVSFSAGRPDLCQTVSSERLEDNLCNGYVCTPLVVKYVTAS